MGKRLGRFYQNYLQPHWRGLLVGLLLLTMAGGLAWFWLKPAPAPVHLTASVVRGDIEDSVLASGVLQPIRKVEVGAQVSGQLKTLSVKLGQRVVKDQQLAVIDPQLALSDLQIAQSDLSALLASRRGNAAKLHQARDEWQRQQALLAGKASSRREWQRAQADYLSLLAERDELGARIGKARHIILQQQTKLSYTRISAPMSGDVLSIDTKEGQTVIAAQQAPKILTLGDLSRMEVWAQVSEADISRIRPGLRAYFYLLGSPDKRHYGVVREILPTPEKINNAMFFNVLFDVDNPQRSLRVEMTAQVAIVTAQQSNSLLLPLTALGESGADGLYSVRVLSPKGAVQVRKVKIGLKSRSQAQVLSGLKLGELVITSAEDQPEFSLSVNMGS